MNAERDAESAEVIEQALALRADLEREGAQGKFMFAEVEEGEADLGKVERWLQTCDGRNLFAALGREAAERAVRETAQAC